MSGGNGGGDTTSSSPSASGPACQMEVLGIQTPCAAPTPTGAALVSPLPACAPPHPAWVLGSDSNYLGLLHRCPTDVTSSMSQTRSLFPQLPPPPCPTWTMDWPLFLGLTLGPFSAARAACPKPILIPLALFKKPPLGSCCKGSLVPAHLNSGISSTHHVPLDPETPT